MGCRDQGGCRCRGLVGLLLLAGCGDVVVQLDGDPGGSGADASVDSTPPVVMAMTPAPKAAELDVETLTITATFSEAMDAESLASAFRVWAFGVAVDGEVAIDGVVATFTPSERVAIGTTYVASIGTDAQDEAGNHLAESRGWVFTTRTTSCVGASATRDCYQTITEAIGVSAPGASIAVASGSYVENLVLDKTVTLLGGYTSDFTERDPFEVRSSISAATANSVVIVNGEEGNSAARAPILDGFSLSGGRAVDGGGVHATWSDVQLHNDTISGNEASRFGGGVFIEYGSPLLSGNAIRQNHAIDTTTTPMTGEGGGLYLNRTSAKVVNNEIDNNDSQVAGGGGRLQGITGNTGPVALVGNRIHDNRSLGEGGGLWIAGVELQITGGAIRDNTASGGRGGGGLFAALADNLVVEGVRVEGNKTTSTAENGGASAILVDASDDFRLASSVVAGNDGGQTAVRIGAGSASDIINVTLVDNEMAAIRTASPLMVANSIFSRETVGVVLDGATASISGTHNLCYLTSDCGLPEAAIMALDGDAGLDESFHLVAGSPLIDAGDSGQSPDDELQFELPTLDVDGEPRVQGDAVDVGADEWSP